MNGKQNHAPSGDNFGGQDENSIGYESQTLGGIPHCGVITVSEGATGEWCLMSQATPQDINAVTDSVGTDLDLAELIEQHEDIDWHSIPGISAAEAGAWTSRLIEARDRVQEGL